MLQLYDRSARPRPAAACSLRGRALRVSLLALTVTLGCGGEGGAAATDAATGSAADSATHDGGAKTDSGASGDGGDGGSGATADASGDTQSAADTTVACHPIKNTGCPAGQHCIYDGDFIRCEDDGAHGLGEDCEDGKGCKVGVCIKPQSGESRCSPFCTSDVQCASGSCNALKTGKGKVCDMGGSTLTPCDILSQDCQEPGMACYGTSKGFGCLKVGVAAGGEACSDENGCQKGFACAGLSGSGNGMCRKVCKIGGGEPSCESITAPCSSLNGSKIAGYCDG